MNLKTVGIVMLGAALLLPVSAWSDDTSDVSKTIGAASLGGLDLPTNPVLSVQLTSKTKKKRLLVVTGTANTVSSATLTLRAEVNGVRLEPDQISQKCSGNCTLAATWWLDLDHAELANPGVFYNKLPLDVDLIAGANAFALGTLSVTAQIVKK